MAVTPADTKISLLPTLTTPQKDDLLLIVHNPAVEPTSQRIELQTLFANVNSPLVTSSNVTIGGSNSTFTISANSVNFTSNVSFTKVVTANTVKATSVQLNLSTPASSNVGVSQGSIWFDSDYIYCATSNTEIKRAPLSSF